jgi:DNA-binding NarL/FixJ family response regulator
LHDVMDQALTSVSINLAEMKQELPRDVATILQERIEESESLTLQTLSTMRELSLELRPSMLDDLGLLPTLHWYVRQFGHRLNVVAIFEAKGVRERLPSGLETVLYRVVQEGLTNIACHAQAQKICVYLNCDGKTLTLLITDDGKGFDPYATSGMGLLGIREWVAAVGGRLRIESTPGQGTRLTVSIQCPSSTCLKKRQTRALDKIKVLLVEEHTIMRKGLLSLLENEPDIKVVGEAADGHEAVRLAYKLQPDVIVMDLNMPLLGGLEAIRHVKRELPESRLVVLTANTTEEYIYQVLETGTSGYLVKQSAPDELVMAIRSACAGDTFLSPSISGDVVQEYIESGQLSEAAGDYALLTDREREVLQLLAEGHSTREIAEVLVLSTKTIETHRANLMNKLDIHNLPDLTRYAIRKGVVSLE